MDPRRRTVLIVDDDRLLCETLADTLTDDRVTVVHAQTGAAGLAVARREPVHVVLLDQALPDTDGVALCPAILDATDRAKIVFMTAYPTFENAVAALRLGASDYLSKPFDVEEVRLAVTTAIRMLELERIEVLDRRRRQREKARTAIVGADGGLADTAHLVRLAAGSDVPVLLTGETGTGKSHLARCVHYLGPRSERPFVAVNCAALPESLAESELFGHEKGAFTGALGSRRGVFELAEGGTVFLDEIGAMPVALQPKLLGVLEDFTVRRVGGERERPVDARVLAATNRDLEGAVRDGGFRSDLYYRLGVLEVNVPPLRERPGDMDPLCRHLLRDICGREVALEPAEIERLSGYGWPGNVRELRNVLERAVLVQGHGRLAPSSLLGPAKERSRRIRKTDAEPVRPLDEVERREIERALRQLDGNLTRTAERLGIALSTLKRKIQRYGLRTTGPN